MNRDLNKIYDFIQEESIMIEDLISASADLLQDYRDAVFENDEAIYELTKALELLRMTRERIINAQKIEDAAK